MNLTKLKSKKFEITEVTSLVKIETKICRSKNMAEEQILCVLCHMEEKRERIVHRLGKRRIPSDLWNYFLESPGHMDLRFAFPPDKWQPLTSNYSFKALTAIPDKEISRNFLGIISTFVEATKKNAVNPNGENVNKLQTKETTTVPSR